MEFEIINSTTQDIDTIFRLYNEATTFQKTKSLFVWPKFEYEMVSKEIEQQRQFKLLINNEIACVWAIAFNDPEIWEKRDKDDAIYIHRIATSSNFRGFGLVEKLVDWAKKYAIINNKHFVRLDTVGNNTGLINYYKKCGFIFLGFFKLENTIGLPEHYHDAEVSLFEIKVV